MKCLIWLLCLALCAGSAFATEWTFDTDDNPSNGATVTVGPYGTGWFPGHEVLGTPSGMWDMGKGGRIVISTIVGENDFCCNVTYYNCLYVAPRIEVIDGSRTAQDSDELIEPDPIKPPVDPDYGWRKITSSWHVENRAIVIIITADERWSALIDSVSVVTPTADIEITKDTADVNGDGKVNIVDLISVRRCCGREKAEGCAKADVNADGKVSVLDLLAVRNAMMAEQAK
jgi:hypothetical protein